MFLSYNYKVIELSNYNLNNQTPGHVVLISEYYYFFKLINELFLVVHAYYFN